MLSILAIALDVDGVLTDGGVYWDGNGGEWKRFSFRDIMGVSLGRKAGLRFACLVERAPELAREDVLERADIRRGYDAGQ